MCIRDSLGLSPLYQAVCEMVEALRTKSDADYSALYGVIADEFEKVRRLEAALTANAKP